MIKPSRRFGPFAAAGVVTSLAGALLTWASQATAQTPPANPVQAEDGLGGGGFYLEADEISQDETNHHVGAKGSVEARYKGRVLRADEIDYDTVTGVVIARGKVQLINADGTAQFADAISLDKDFSEGVAIGFSTRLGGEAKMAAASAIRQSPTLTELRQAIYTPCPVCAEPGHEKPTWSIRASKVIQDKKRHVIYYQNATIEVMGVGLVRLPSFWTADPQAERRSGFLRPRLIYTGRRGLSYDQPYYQVISPSEDVTITPQLSTKAIPFLNVEWRKRFYSGLLDARAGFTYDRDFDSNGVRFGPYTTRSYILAKGAFDFAKYWQWGFTAERTSDDLIFDKYDVPNVFQERGLYAVDDRRLISQLYLTRQDQRSYLSIAAISVQGLRSNDIDSTFPTIAPLIEARWEPRSLVLGGQLRLQGSAVYLGRDRSPSNPLLPGTDSGRATGEVDWRRTFTLPIGLRLEPFLQARGDFFRLSDLPAPYAATASIARGTATAGLNISYPLIRRTTGATFIVEPQAQLALSPNTRQDPRIPNEDSVVWEFDETNLFQANKSPGFDLYEGGQRINLGGRFTAILNDGRSASVLIGRSYRAHDDPALPARTGLSTRASDWIVSAEATPIKGVSLFSRWRLDTSTLAINRLEAGADLKTSRISGYIRYLQEGQLPTGGKFKGVDFQGDIFATKHWGLTVYAVRDFDQQKWLRRDIGIVYRDDCLRLEVVYRRNDTFNSTLGPSSSVALRLTLATLGNSGYRP